MQDLVGKRQAVEEYNFLKDSVKNVLLKKESYQKIDKTLTRKMTRNDILHQKDFISTFSAKEIIAIRSCKPLNFSIITYLRIVSIIGNNLMVVI